MYTLEDYLNFRGDLSFDVSPVNEIDEMVFSAIGKADFTGILRDGEIGRYSEAFARFFETKDNDVNARFGLLASPIMMRVLHAISLCPRYADIKISNFINRISTEKTEQMSALTVLGPNDKIYVTFRGTDDTLVGWKENCELAILNSVPAQRDAVTYLETVAEIFKGPLVVTGHSKGGNLAVYAAANADEEIRGRIEKVISYDGPGFRKEFFETEGYQSIQDKVSTLVPKASIVGMLMENAGRLEVVECESEGPAAHDIFVWNLGREGFLRAQDLTEKSLVFRQAIENTLDEMDMTERQEFVNELFEALSSTGAVKLLDFTEQSLAQIIKLSGNFNRSKEIREFILDLSRFFIKGAAKNTLEELQERIQEHIQERKQDKFNDPVKEKTEEPKDPDESSQNEQESYG